MSKKKEKKIAFVGISHLSLSYIAVALKKGFEVYVFDTDQELINKVKNNKLFYQEPNLDKVFNNFKSKIHFLNDFKEINKLKIIFIAKDIKTDENGNSNLFEVKNLIKKTIKFIKRKTSIILLSQIPPGFMRKINFPKSQLYYQVETLVFGQALKRAMNPERIIIGCADKRKKINSDYNSFLKKFDCPVIRMSYESAELTKIAINLYLASSITTSNTLSRICEKINANWSEIMPALKLDKRIGRFAYLKPGLGITGGNIERDVTTIKKILNSDKIFQSLPLTINKISRQMKSWVFNKLQKKNFIKKKNVIGILGLTYKINTNSIKNSVSIELLKKIKNKVVVYDPKVKLNLSFSNITQVHSKELICKYANIIIIMTPWPEFKFIEKFIQHFKKEKIVIIDPFSFLKKELFLKNKIKYYSLF